MSSPDEIPVDWRSNQVSLPTGNRYVIVGPPEVVLVPKQGLVLVRKQDLEHIEKQIRQDLERIEKRIEVELGDRGDYLQNLAGTLFGTAVGIACTIPQLMTASSLSNWVVPIFTVSSIALCFISLILLLIDRNLRAARKKNAISITAEIRDLLGEGSHYHVEPTDDGSLVEGSSNGTKIAD